MSLLRTMDLRPGVGGKSPASLVSSAPEHFLQLDEIWPPILREHGEEDREWVWERLRTDLEYQAGVEVAVLLQGEMAQGCVITSLPAGPRSMTGLAALPLYVEYLSIAPWNRRILSARLFKAVGPVLLWHAVTRSVEAGRTGRIALHSAFPRSSEFYRKLKLAERGKDPDAAMLPLFEGDEAWAREFLRVPT